MSVITGTAMWAHVQAPNQFGKYSIDVIIPEDEYQELLGEGVSGLKETDDGFVVQIRTNATMKDGSPAKKPVVVDKEGIPITDLVGNGSKVKVKFNVAEWKFGSKKGKSAYLNAVKVLELVPYETDDDWGDDSDPEDMF